MRLTGGVQSGETQSGETQSGETQSGETQSFEMSVKDTVYRAECQTQKTVTNDEEEDTGCDGLTA